MASNIGLTHENVAPSAEPPAVTLRHGAIKKRGILAAYSAANMAPAIATLFVMGAIVSGAGEAAPLIVLWAGIAWLFHVNTCAEFAKVSPSSGSYVTFLGRSFGPIGGGVTGFGLVFAMSSVGAALIYQIGLWTSTAVTGLFGYHLAWWIPGLVLMLLAATLVAAGVVLSVRAAIALFSFEVFVILAGAIGMLVANSGSISGAGFNPANIHNGASGLGIAFPLAAFLFVGASAPNTLAEETARPRRMLPLAMIAGTLLGTVLYVLTSWSEGIGFRNDVALLLKTPFPFLVAAQRATPWLGDLVYIAGFTSALAVLVVSLNVVCRVWFSMARDGLLPKQLRSLHSRARTPWVAVLCYTAIALGITFVVNAIVGPTKGFTYTASFGTVIYVVVYIAANIALPVHYLRTHRSLYSVIRHMVLPVVGTALLLYPLWAIVKPTQPRPYNWFGLVVLVILVVGVAYSRLLQRRGVVAGSVLAQETEREVAGPLATGTVER